MWEDLQRRLQDPDQWVRVEALRIVAMVEETRALSSIEAIFKNDPEPGVRQVAQWAGRIVFAAYKQEKRATEQIEATTESSSNRHEEMLINSMIDKGASYNLMQDQLLHQEMQEAMKKASATQKAPPPLVPTIEPRRNTGPLRPVVDLMELLDAGLSESFFE